MSLCLAAAGMCAVVLYPAFRRVSISASDIRVAQPELAVRSARALIARHTGEPLIRVESLPPSLRIPKLRYATIHQDHIDLVLARNPDWSIGARIWSEHHRPHRDEATKYRDIWFYDHTNDVAPSPENLP